MDINNDSIIAMRLYHKAKHNDNRRYSDKSKEETLISKDPYYSLLYAKNILKDRFKIAEYTIAKFPRYAYRYAKSVLRGRFKIAEKNIRKSSFSFEYQRDILMPIRRRSIQNKIDKENQKL